MRPLFRDLKTAPIVQQAAARLVGHTLAVRGARLLHPRCGVILAYHDAPPEIVEAHLDVIARVFRIASMDEVADRLQRDGDCAGLAAVTFDDGFERAIVGAVALVRSRGWPMTFYLPTRWVDGGMAYWFTRLVDLLATAPSTPVGRFGRTWRLDLPEERIAFQAQVGERLTRVAAHAADSFLDELEAETSRGRPHVPPSAAPAAAGTRAVTWAQVKEAALVPGVTFGSHTVTHSCLAAIGPADLESEIVGARDAIAARTGRPVRHFCYPYGGMDRIGSRAIEVAGRVHDTAVTLERGLAGPGSNRLLLPRVAAYPKDSPAVLVAKVVAAYLGQ